MSDQKGHSGQATLYHANCVALDARRALLIKGPSGSGKSTLSLQLMGYGALLVSDDQTFVEPLGNLTGLRAFAAQETAGMIEARGVGLLRAEGLKSAHVVGVVDMSVEETERLPPFREIVIEGVQLPVFHKSDGPGFAPALLQWLKGGRRA